MNILGQKRNVEVHITLTKPCLMNFNRLLKAILLWVNCNDTLCVLLCRRSYSYVLARKITTQFLPSKGNKNYRQLQTSSRIWWWCMTSICWDSTVIVRWRFRVSSLHESSKLAQYLFPGDDLFPLSLSLLSRDNLNALTKIQAPNKGRGWGRRKIGKKTVE